MGLLHDLKSAAGKVKNVFEDVEDELKKDMKSIVNDVEDGWDTFEQDVESILGDVEKTEAELYQKAKQLITTEFQDLGIDKVIDKVKKGFSPDPFSDLSSIKSKLENLVQNAEDQSSDDFDYLMNKYLKPIGKDIKDVVDTFKSISVGTTAEVTGVLGASEILSLGYTFSGEGDIRISSQTGVSFGAEESAEVGVFLGVWTQKPKNLKGALFSFDLEGDFEVGVGLKIYLDLETFLEFVLEEVVDSKGKDWGFRGFIVIATVGEAAEVSGEISSNMTYSVSG